MALKESGLNGSLLGVLEGTRCLEVAETLPSISGVVHDIEIKCLDEEE